jgi:hypothetical protein
MLRWAKLCLPQSIRGRGVLDKDDVPWITNEHEHYVRDKPLSHHARYLPRDVPWYADPSEPGTICDLRCAGFTIQKADNAQNPGISAVHSRIEAGQAQDHRMRLPQSRVRIGAVPVRGRQRQAGQGFRSCIGRFALFDLQARRQTAGEEEMVLAEG